MTAPYDVPDARELVEAVRDYLADDLLARAEGRDRWLVRIAANALSIVERELRLGPEHGAAHLARLGTLGYADDATLAAAIRAGELDDGWSQLEAALWATVADKLAVANPDYAV